MTADSESKRGRRAEGIRTRSATAQETSTAKRLVVRVGDGQEPLSTKAKIMLDKIRKLWYNVENRKTRYGDGDKASCTVTRDGGSDFRKSTTCDGAKKSS